MKNYKIVTIVGDGIPAGGMSARHASSTAGFCQAIRLLQYEGAIASRSFCWDALISYFHQNAAEHAVFRVHFCPIAIDLPALLVNARSGHPIRYIFCIATW